MKRAKIYNEFIEPQSEFSHRFACWGNNHNGWVKMKKAHKRTAKRRIKHKQRMEDLYAGEYDD